MMVLESGMRAPTVPALTTAVRRVGAVPQHDGAFADRIETMWANSGGPMSRTRRETIRSSILGQDKGAVFCPRQLTLALDFGQLEPTETMTALLRARGLSSPEDLRPLFTDIPGPMLCCVSPGAPRLSVAKGEPAEILRQAFLLGLCTAVFFDPSRPVLWTRASLTRRLTLFDTMGFYA